MLTTPTEPLGSEVHRFCAEVEASEPVFVPVRTASWAEPDECYATIERQVAEHGGETLYGWTIWFDPRVFIEAEFHAVWKSPAGELMDLSLREARRRDLDLVLAERQAVREPVHPERSEATGR